ncbi:EAL domain-containing protein [Lysobacter sp. A3-1-A15]|uniref:EAL domain-containing protein n=1 Tax=Novilysobacter viscosus TaxID=3098602 RepID=UPI002EDB5201
MGSDSFPIPPDEDARLADLASFDILDSASELDLDDIAALAAQVCDTPIATITFVDGTRQWFKARIGLDMDQTPREVAFCAHTLMHHEVLVVADAQLDPRFRDNPMVLAAPFLRFYAGYPLVTSAGSAVGTVAVMDRVPRQLTAHQHFALQVMAQQVVKWLELRRAVRRLQDTVVERDQVNRELHEVKHQLEDEVARKSKALDRAASRQARAELLYTSVWDTTSDAIVIMDRHSTIRFANPSVLALFGHEHEALIGQPLALLQPERLRARHLAGLQRYLDTGVRRLDWRSTEAVALKRDGSELPIEVSFSEIELGGEVHFVGMFRDITDRKHAEQVIFEEKERAQATLGAIADGVIVVDQAGTVTYLNPTAELLTGLSAARAIGRSHGDVLALEDAQGEPESLDSARRDGPDESAPLPITAPFLRRPDGTTIAIEGNLTQLRDRAGNRAGTVVAFRDVSQWRKLAAQLSFQATHDALTGLPNRAELERRVDAALVSASRLGHVHSLLYLDLDQFKVVNDTCGHIAGDELLGQLSQMLGPLVRSRDTLARIGGDEFCLLLEDCAELPALQVAEKLRQAITEFPFAWNGHTFNVGVSIGHVCFGDTTMTVADILSKADEACYLAKDLGRNRVHTYRAGDEELARRHGEMEWVGQIRKALREQRFVLYVQQIFSLGDPPGPAHYEILLRMRGEDGQLVPPMSFIPAAERYNLMPEIDRWVIGAVCRHLGARIQADPEAGSPRYAINLSGGSVSDAHLAGHVRELLAATGVPGSSICFEITETAAIRNMAHAVRLMHELKAEGCQFALDDFGSGMSSFAYLKSLPVDALKIDGAFVRDIADDPVDYAMVKAIHDIGHLMGLKTVAEFVESERILEQLRHIGVDYGQGYALGEPVHFL